LDVEVEVVVEVVPECQDDPADVGRHAHHADGDEDDDHLIVRVLELVEEAHAQ